MEAEIYFAEGVSPQRKTVTDLDTVALIPSNFGELSFLIGDCKTLKNQSPITRSFWLSGLMGLLRAERGIVLLTKEIERDHKQLSSNMNVSLMSEKDFEILAKKTTTNYKLVNSALCDGDTWDKYFELYKRFPHLENAVKYVKNDFWNISDDKLKLRKTLYTIRGIRRELNPDNPEHVALLIDLISLFSVTLNRVTLDIFNQYLLPETKENLSRELKIWLWGGMDQYLYWNKLYQIASNKGNDNEIELPEWDLFVQLIRQFLEEPYSTSRIPLLLREIAFETMSAHSSDYTLSRQLATKYSQAAKFAVMIASYVCKAALLPKDFDSLISEKLMDLQSF
ncbi:hypothetical protein BC6307_07125 [Sutcliffiella cohnii]|uniref:Uncharacterized protein n=1 Tax=Sutcliffiella cohnii TaxID=33932 RepID=A0A223KNI0_9BACI|nr:hypothetical protein [Sutcliffiella cohnii]AST91065.1 hypothetical protein BC6307_07125 [Sutcliffiella cohnii]